MVEHIQRGRAEQEDLRGQADVVPALDDARRLRQTLCFIDHQHCRAAEESQAIDRRQCGGGLKTSLVDVDV